ncbi:hypothetical protein ACKFRM_09780 [Corynebacterium sp. YSMAA1_1_D6]|uniref:hypothetical protein n=1 Tax=Corynebacterium sp. YSMAA1_1_D6 TaxID=3383589 RepID=UPI0038D1E223
MTNYDGFSQFPQYPQTSETPYAHQQYEVARRMSVPPRDVSFAIGQGFDGVFKEWLVWGVAGFVYYFLLQFVAIASVLLTAGVGPMITAPFLENFDFWDGLYDWPFSAAVWLTILAPLVVLWLTALWGRANYHVGARKAVDGEKVNIADVFGFRGRGGIMLVLACVDVLVFGGLVLFVVPGLVAAVLLWAAPHIKADNPDKGLVECLRLSATTSPRHAGRTTLLVVLTGIAGLVFLFIPILGMYGFAVVCLAQALFARALLERPAVRWS